MGRLEVDGGSHVFKGHRAPLTNAMFSRDETFVVTASADRTAKIWKRDSCECLRTFNGHKNYVRRAVLSADDSVVLTVSEDRTAKVWSNTNGECIMTITDQGA